MQPYQEQYIRNAERAAALYAESRSGVTAAEEELCALKEDCTALLNEHLFPTLDGLHGASDEEIRDLTVFADRLMDWSTNLDPGVYTAIHEALLRRSRMRKDRNGMIRELYKLGMGLYYERRIISGIDDPEVASFAFRNELVFTEAASYMRYFEQIDDEETRGYIIRALANVALCTRGHRKRIAASRRTLEILRDEHYRALAPGLPWEAFLRKTHQQMSSNRSELSRGDLTKEDLASVLDSCYEVFKPEEKAENPSVRWLWPYYEMEMNCGYADLATTLARMEMLISRTKSDEYDMSGLYGNIQLAVYYGRMLRKHRELRTESGRLAFYAYAVDKMMRTFLSAPASAYDDYFYYNVMLVVTDYYETEGVPAYREITETLMRHFAPDICRRGIVTGRLSACLAEALLAEDPGIFDELPVLASPGIAGAGDPEKKKALLLSHAEECGLFCNFGMIKMNCGRLLRMRSLFESEDRMVRLHTVSGYDDLRERRSTEHLAEAALGHHRYYDGTGGYPERYVRNDSPSRMMTDVVAAAAFAAEKAEELCAGTHAGNDNAAEEIVRGILEGGGRRFSPLVAACLADKAVRERFVGILLARDGENEGGVTC